MHKFLSGAALSATIFAANMAPVLANPTNIKTGNSVTVNSVAPKSSLIEIEGRTLTDAEAAKVEGEAIFVPVFVWIAGKAIVKYVAKQSVKQGVKATANHAWDCRSGARQNCNAQSHGAAFRSGATFGLWR
jgi:hypothetical protein